MDLHYNNGQRYQNDQTSMTHIRNTQEDVKGRMYYVWSGLRDLLFDLTEALARERGNPEALEDFKLLMLIAHYLATRSACQTQQGLQDLATKLAFAQLKKKSIQLKCFYKNTCTE